MARPNFEDIHSGEQFNKWYWLKDEMIEILKRSNLPINGSKFELRDRIMYALDNEGLLRPMEKAQTKSKFNWAKEELSLETKITDNISFGPNFRGFMKSQVGNGFSCHSDFMDWVKANVGLPLSDAVSAWKRLERRKEDPAFRRDIAKHNMYAQYIRDFLDSNKESSMEIVRLCWKLKKKLPTKNGLVIYEDSDLDLIK